MSWVEDVRAAGWSQGATLLATTEITTDLIEAGQLYLVISHPCDVVSLDAQRDPFVELIKANVISQMDGNLTFGKNSRRLHLRLGQASVELRAAERLVVDRQLLATVSPQDVLGDGDRRLLAAWLASRYARPAFPDEFNGRLKTASRQIEKALRTKGEHISGIYITTELAELEPEVDYNVVIFMTMTPERFDTPSDYADVNEARDQIESALTAVDGIHLVDLSVVSEDAMTLDELRTLSRWDYDSISFREGNGSTLPVST